MFGVFRDVQWQGSRLEFWSMVMIEAAIDVFEAIESFSYVSECVYVYHRRRLGGNSGH